MKKSIATVLFFVALTYPQSRAAAESISRDITFNVSAGGLTFSKKDNLRTEPVFDVRIGYDILGTNITDSIGIEGGLSYVSTFSKKDNTPVNAYLFRVDATYPLFPRKRIVPFLSLGAGGMFMDRGTSMDNAPVLAYGLGLKYFVQEFIAMRLDVRQNILFAIGTRNDNQFMFGLSFLLDRDKKIRRLPLPPPPPVEKKTPISTSAVPTIDFTTEKVVEPAAPAKQVEPQAKQVEPEARPIELPLPAAVVAAPIGMAAQALGLPKAELPKAPAPEPPPARAVVQPEPQPVQPEPQPVPAAPPVVAPPVQTQAEPAAPLEQAVVDRIAADSLTPPPPHVPEEEMVASILCPLDPPAGTAPRVLKQPAAVVMFDSGSAVVKKQFQPEIDKIATYVMKHPGSSVYIEGHADRVGKPEMNMKLSQERVDSVKKSLTKGMKSKKVKVVTSAFGCRVPVDTNKGEKGRRKNRRATIEVTKP